MFDLPLIIEEPVNWYKEERLHSPWSLLLPQLLLFSLLQGSFPGAAARTLQLLPWQFLSSKSFASP